MKESEFQTHMLEAAKALGGFSINFAPSIFMKAGIPDLYICLMGWDGFLELKVNNIKFTQGQLQSIFDLNANIPNKAFGLVMKTGTHGKRNSYVLYNAKRVRRQSGIIEYEAEYVAELRPSEAAKDREFTSILNYLRMKFGK